MTPVEFLRHWQACGMTFRLADDCTYVDWRGPVDSVEDGDRFKAGLDELAGDVARLLAIRRSYQQFAVRFEIPRRQQAEDLAQLEGNGDREHLRRSLAIMQPRPYGLPDCCSTKRDETA